MPLTLRTGFEAALLLPPTSGRRQLAERIARRVGGAVKTVSHEELSLTLGPGRPWHLARGFTVRDRDGEPACHLVGEVATSEHGHGPATFVTPVLATDHAARLEALLGPARELGAAAAPGSAVHLHVDAAPFRSPHALANLVRLFGCWREPLHALLGSDPARTGLDPLPSALLDLVEQPGDGSGPLQRAAAAAGPMTSCDVDLTALLVDDPVRDAVEIRILPATLHASDLVRRAALVEGLLVRCLDTRPFPHQVSADVQASAAELGCSADSGMTAALPSARRRSPLLTARADTRGWAAPVASLDLEPAG